MKENLASRNDCKEGRQDDICPVPLYFIFTCLNNSSIICVITCAHDLFWLLHKPHVSMFISARLIAVVWLAEGQEVGTQSSDGKFGKVRKKKCGCCTKNAVSKTSINLHINPFNITPVNKTSYEI